ncbi:plasmid replication protein RepX [Striga asiatica]|uniref:Plasmid replication protein RepX n=1 Tax=Striga asiatica TaxID=4170 RepID=A0A5A7NXH0_STRAF|nr:plasmid replication protein RepX [Striga asiatica]
MTVEYKPITHDCRAMKSPLATDLIHVRRGKKNYTKIWISGYGERAYPEFSSKLNSPKPYNAFLSRTGSVGVRCIGIEMGQQVFSWATVLDNARCQKSAHLLAFKWCLTQLSLHNDHRGKALAYCLDSLNTINLITSQCTPSSAVTPILFDGESEKSVAAHSVCWVALGLHLGPLEELLQEVVAHKDLGSNRPKGEELHEDQAQEHIVVHQRLGQLDLQQHKVVALISRVENSKQEC